LWWNLLVRRVIMSQGDVLKLLRKYKELTTNQIVEKLNVSHSTIASNTRKLRQQGDIKLKIERQEHNIPRYVYIINEKASQKPLKRKLKGFTSKHEPKIYKRK